MSNFKHLHAGLGGCLECIGDLWVQLNGQALFLEELLVSLLNLLMHPIRKDVLEHGRADVGDPLLGQLQVLLAIGQVMTYCLVRRNQFGYVLDGEALISSLLLYTVDAADERPRVELGGRRSIKKKRHKDKWQQVCAKNNKKERIKKKKKNE